ncbi:MAG: cell division protein ZapA [Bacteroidales bacterium]
MKINIKIDGKEYPLSIDRDKERLYRDAVGKLNEQILRYRKKYDAQRVDRDDIFAMVAFSLALRTEELENELDFDPIVNEVEAMINAIDSYL